MNWLNHGIYTWKIDDTKLVQKLFNAKCGDKFESEQFMLARLPWRFEIYPNGNNQEFEGFFVIHLRLLTLPANIDKIMVHRIFRVMENMAASSWLSIMNEGEIDYWGRKCPLSELVEMNCQTITVQAQLAIHKIILKQKDEMYLQNDFVSKVNYPLHSKITYKYYGDELAIFKKSKNGKELFCGDIVDNMWCLSVYPNGDSQSYDGRIGVFLNLHKLPTNITKLNTKFTISCIETSKTEELTTNMFSMRGMSYGRDGFMTLESAMDLDELTFVADINILSVEESKEDNNSLQISDPSQITKLLSGYTTSDTIKSNVDDEKQGDDTHNNTQQKIASMTTELLSMRKQYNTLQQQMEQQKKESDKQIQLILEELKQIKQSHLGIIEEKKEESEEVKVKKWLTDIVKLPQYFNILIEAGFDDLDCIGDITMDDLDKIDIPKLGHKKKIIKAAKNININQSFANVNVPYYQSQQPIQPYSQNINNNNNNNNNSLSSATWICTNCNWNNVSSMQLCARCGVKKINTRNDVEVEGVNIQDTAK